MITPPEYKSCNNIYNIIETLDSGWNSSAPREIETIIMENNKKVLDSQTQN
jgi:hypothetical protein